MKRVVLAIALMLSACQQQPQSVELLSEPVVSEQAGLELTVSSLIVDPEIVSIELKVVNQSDRPIPFYPDQGAAIVDGLQIDAANVYTEGDVSGELAAGAAKEGIIYYPVTGDAIATDEIKQIQSESRESHPLVGWVESEAAEWGSIPPKPPNKLYLEQITSLFENVPSPHSILQTESHAVPS